MAKRTFMTQNQTFTAQTAGAALTNATYMGIVGGSTTQVVDVLEVLISGMASASTVAAMDFSAVATVATTPTALAAPNHDFGMNQYITALTSPVTTYVAAANGPVTSTAVTGLTLNLALNLFGGIIRWNAAPTQQVT